MITIRVGTEELRQGFMTGANLDRAVTAIRQDGFVMVENIVAHNHLDILRAKMMQDSQKLIAAEKWGGAGGVKGHLQQRPPPFAPYIFQDVVANPFVIQITKAVLGDGIYNRFYSSNTNCPGSGTQPLHLDAAHLWPNLAIAHPTANLAVNLPLVDVTEENGSIELWPGSHLDPKATKILDLKRIEERRKVAPPIRGNSKKGSVLIRDMRVWHRGMPNYSKHCRHMIAMVHNIWWHRAGRPLRFNTGCEEIFENCDLAPNYVFTDQPIDYLFAKTL